jgi:catechol 2,3-dioxygenase-like lactoylglutathione lyase family enzyme
MEQRISLITLGVADLARSRAFYEALGWAAEPASTEGIVYFDLGGPALALLARAALARGAVIEDGGAAFSGLTLTYYVRRQEEIYDLLGQVQAAGGSVLKAAAKVPWGGYVGWFADPDGHPWEVAWSPNVRLDAGGRLRLS